MTKRTLLGGVALMALTATACFSIAAATGFASSRVGDYNMYPGDYVAVRGLDWECNYLRKTRKRRVAAFSCGRESSTYGIGVYLDRSKIEVYHYRSGRRSRLLITARRTHDTR